jgi:hypothetical protein
MILEKEQKAVAYLDLLGFSSLTVADMRAAENHLSDFYEITQDIKAGQDFESIELFLFSDSLFAHGPSVKDAIMSIFADYIAPR